MSGPFERALDAALLAFAKGGDKRGEKLKALNERAADRLPLDQLKQFTVPITTMSFKNGKHLYLDTFLPESSRSFELFLYDRTDKKAPPPETATLDEVVRLRLRQMHYFLETFGEFFPFEGFRAHEGCEEADRGRGSRYAGW